LTSDAGATPDPDVVAAGRSMRRLGRALQTVSDERERRRALIGASQGRLATTKQGTPRAPWSPQVSIPTSNVRRPIMNAPVSANISPATSPSAALAPVDPVPMSQSFKRARRRTAARG